MVDAGIREELVSPFIERCAREPHDGWEALLGCCLTHPSYQKCAVSVALSLTEPPEDLMQAALSLLPGMTDLLENRCAIGQVSSPVIPRLLTHEAQVAGAAARGLWLRDGGAWITEELKPLWRKVVVGLEPDELPTGDIFEHDSELAIEWLRLYVAGGERHSLFLPSEVEQAIAVISGAERAALLEQVADSLLAELVIDLLISGSLSVYQALLRTDRLRSHHLTLLSRLNRPCWPEMVVAALGAGYSVADIAGAALLPRRIGYSGDMSRVWQERMDAWSKWLGHPDERVRDVARSAIRLATEERERALKQEHQQKVRGEL